MSKQKSRGRQKCVGTHAWSTSVASAFRRTLSIEAHARMNSLRKKSSRCHSEPSEESLLIQNESLRGILRAKSALRMMAFRFFPQPMKAGTTESKTDRQADYSAQSINDEPRVLSLTGPAHPRSE